MATERTERNIKCANPGRSLNIRDRHGYLLIEVGQPVHALELVTLEFAVEYGWLRNVFTCMDGWVGKAVALSKPRA